MADVFGYNQEVKSGEVITSKDVIIQIDNGRTVLVQTIQGSYQHRVEPQFEIGSSNMYLVNGQPSGTLALSSLVGKGGWLDGIINGTPACGDLQSLQFKIQNNDCSLSVGKPILRFEAALVRDVSFSIQAGQLSVTQSANFVCGKLIRR